MRIEGRLRGTSPNYFVEMFETFQCAVALYGMARKSKKKKIQQSWNKTSSQDNKAVRSGSPNVQHCVLSLQVEQAALDGNSDTANKGFQNAIRLAARSDGHMHHAALFHERYADILRHNWKDAKKTQPSGWNKQFAFTGNRVSME